jgi:hypothetical protein
LFVRVGGRDPVISERSVGLEELAFFLLVIGSGGTFLAGFLWGDFGAELRHLVRDIVIATAASLDTVRFTIVNIVATSTVYTGVQVVEGVQTDAIGFCKLFTGVGAGS